MISIKKVPLLFLYLAAACSFPSIQATSMTPAEKKNFSEQMRARLDRLGVRERRNARMRRRMENAVGSLSMLKKQRAKELKRHANKANPKDPLLKYEKFAGSFAQKLSEQPPLLQQRFALLVTKIVTVGVPMSDIQSAFATAALAGLDANLLSLVQDGMELFGLASEIEDASLYGYSEIRAVQDKVVAPVLGCRFDRWISEQASLAQATPTTPDDPLAALLAGLSFSEE